LTASNEIANDPFSQTIGGSQVLIQDNPDEGMQRGNEIAVGITGGVERPVLGIGTQGVPPLSLEFGDS